ncbi:hypothetical protein OHA18_13990 [Kribbella sp. NBC_00709]|uniref:hypothetical protein n=1 Tax=Kribbella sp. NBC_00709 TaxID=2975972 RepID=UPI002E2D71DF|nr:hypothetical protein [Kribbella sp. NBC_00709]
MADPDPEPTPAPDPEPAAAAEAEPGSTAEVESDPKADSKAEAEPEEDPAVKQQRTVNRFLWSCAWLTALAGLFLVAGIAQSDGGGSALRWLGAVVAIVCMLALIAGYVACARGKLTLRARALGPLDVFQTSTLVVLIAVICGLLAPSSNSAALALLFPWALTYWMYGLDRTRTPST